MELPTGVKIVFLLVSAAYASPALNQARRLFNLTPASVCTSPGEVICSSDCREMRVCLGDGAGGYNQVEVATCYDGRCSAEKGDCVEEADSECHPPVQDYEFNCHSVGDFPDPYDCQMFHTCAEVDGESVHGTCTGKWAYNPGRADCSLTTSDRVCTEGPIPACKKLGQVGAVPENPSIYYICKEKFDSDLVWPEIYKCDGNMVFDPQTAICVEP